MPLQCKRFGDIPDILIEANIGPKGGELISARIDETAQISSSIKFRLMFENDNLSQVLSLIRFAQFLASPYNLGHS